MPRAATAAGSNTKQASHCSLHFTSFLHKSQWFITGTPTCCTLKGNSCLQGILLKHMKEACKNFTAWLLGLPYLACMALNLCVKFFCIYHDKCVWIIEFYLQFTCEQCTVFCTQTKIFSWKAICLLFRNLCSNNYTISKKFRQTSICRRRPNYFKIIFRKQSIAASLFEGIIDLCNASNLYLAS